MDPFWGGFGLQRGHFSVKMYAKTKELGPVGGRVPTRPLDPPMLVMLKISPYEFCSRLNLVHTSGNAISFSFLTH